MFQAGKVGGHVLMLGVSIWSFFAILIFDFGICSESVVLFLFSFYDINTRENWKGNQE
jgi:hypothetical protein